MPTFGIETEDDFYARAFFNKTNLRLSEENVIKNPFKGRIHIYDKGFAVVDLQPIYFNVAIVGLVAFLIPFLFGGFNITAWCIPGVIIMCLGFCWTRYFFYLIIRIGLSKTKYKGKVKLLPDNETIRRCLTWDKRTV